MLSDYYRPRKQGGDYVVIHRHTGRNMDGTWPGRWCNHAPSGAFNDDIPGRRLSACVKVKRLDVPADIRRALDGPDSGLSDSAIREATQSLYAVVFADAWEEAGGRFRGGSAIEDVCPPVPEAGVEIVRGWVRELDDVSPYPLFDLFTAMQWEDSDEGHGTGLYYLIMGCWGHGVGLFDFDGGSDDRMGPARKILGEIDESPLNLEDYPLRDLADEWVASHPPDPKNPMEVPNHVAV